MRRIETTIDKIKEDIRNFYKPDVHHFMVINAVDLGEKPDGYRVELQWFFCEYANPLDVIVFCVQIQPGVKVPSIKDIVESAWIAEAELVDLMDIEIENTARGFVLEPDFESGPLRKKK